MQFSNSAPTKMIASNAHLFDLSQMCVIMPFYTFYIFLTPKFNISLAHIMVWIFFV